MYFLLEVVLLTDVSGKGFAPLTKEEAISLPLPLEMEVRMKKLSFSAVNIRQARAYLTINFLEAVF